MNSYIYATDSFEFLPSTSLAILPFLAHADSCAFCSTSKGCSTALSEDRVWEEMLVHQFGSVIQFYADLLASLASLPSNSAYQPIAIETMCHSLEREKLFKFLRKLPSGGARQAYVKVALTTCDPFVLQPRARLVLEIHELSDWNRYQKRLLLLRQTERVAVAFANHAVVNRLQEAIVSTSLELLALEAVASGEGNLFRPASLQEGIAWNAEMELSLVKILEKRGEQRRNWFRKQREFLLQDLCRDMPI